MFSFCSSSTKETYFLIIRYNTFAHVCLLLFFFPVPQNTKNANTTTAAIDLLLTFNASSISALCCCVYPPAIIWKISLVVVYSVNAQIVSISMSNCPIIKFLKVIFPFFADSDSSPSVILIPVVALSITPIFHMTPNSV